MDALVPQSAAGAHDPLRVLGFAGSLRARSYNRALLRSAQELAPEGMVIDIYESIELPLFNEDVEAQGDPEPVAAFKWPFAKPTPSWSSHRSTTMASQAF